MRQILFINGIALLILAVLALPCIAVDVYFHNRYYPFLVVACCATLFAIFCLKFGTIEKLNRSHILFITTYNWLVIIIFAAIPFKLYGLNFIDALFESTSGITTTGATVIQNLQNHSKGILLWRAMLHMLGGVGIIIFTILILPIFKNIELKKLFYDEFSNKSEKVVPKTSKIAFTVLITYFSLILCCITSYYLLGMELFDAVCHGISTISTGGFTNYDESFAYYNSAIIEYAAVFFMILSALPFVWLAKIFYLKRFTFDEQVKYFLFIFFTVCFISVFDTYYFEQNKTIEIFLKDLRYSIFSIASLMTTTGFISFNYSAWLSYFPGLAIFFLMFCGGSSGSTTGGIKIFRIVLLIKIIKKEIGRIINPYRVGVIKFNRNTVNENVILSLTPFLALYLATFVFSSLIISLYGYNYITSLSASAATLTNSGPGLGALIGPTGNYIHFPDTIKIMLSFCMLLGRLEIIPVITFFIIMIKMKIK